MAALFTVGIVINVTYFLLIRTGMTRRLKDPALLQPQIYTALVMALAVIHATDEARGVMLMLFVSLQLFGLFGLSRRQFKVLALAIISGYAGLVALEFWWLRPREGALREEMLRLLALAMITVWMAFVCSQIVGMRRALARRKWELKLALARLEESAARDELTGLHNRRHLMSLLGNELARAARCEAPFSVALIDLDFFKQVNDRHGHQVGDELLQGFSTFAQGQLRALDRVGILADEPTVGRYGGEEFLLILPHTEHESALACVERLRASVASHAIATSAGPLGTSFSAGVAQYEPGESIASLLRRADTALYRAKHDGRNRAYGTVDSAQPLGSNT
ncbi:GGDEF domain-containing protein [Cognatilysobacter bugurensis]|uniref:GGDEF domain-containing protein n=1 Tax=Cognatilysobacter bugurensis TaxID=543356 RepID=UPI0016780700|nr:GGDEF domain-containing protein [Lysobacter bugurensis]